MDSIIGQKFGRWLVTGFAYKTDKHILYYHCRCECGTERDVKKYNLVHGVTKSCGCYSKDVNHSLRFNSLVGKRYGNLFVESIDHKEGYSYFYRCRCDCGKEIISRGTLLSRRKSCGCERKPMPSGVPLNNLVGKRFGMLVVDSFAYQKNKNFYWNCVCDCGNAVVKSYDSLHYSKLQSCGCNRVSYNFDDLTGKVFSHLTVISFAGRKNRHSYWNCRCDCGKELIVEASHLKTSHTVSCGHLNIAVCGSKEENEIKNYILCLIQESSMIRDIKDSVVNTYKAVKFLGIKNKKALWQWNCLVCGEVREGDLSHAKRFSCKELKKQQKIQSFVGTKFGDLLVESFAYVRDSKNYWNCKCSCGNITCVTTDKLVSGNTKSCGCKRIKHGKEHYRFRDITGQTFGNLTAIEPVDGKWLFQCNCGNKKIIALNDVVSGRTQSCGCLRHRSGKDSPRFQDIAGTRFGKLIAIEPMGGDNWLFFCTSCGKGKVMNLSNVRAGKCYSCGCMNTAIMGSKDEIEIRDFIQDSGLEIKKTKILNGKEIDIYIPKLKLGIEYNGSAFHASKGGVYNNKSKTYHQEKFIEAKKQGIHLISIFDFAWKSNQDKLRAYLSDLVVPPKKIFARKCELKEIEKAIAKDFTDKHHLQGSARLQEINYGLYYNNELLSVMSFGKPRYKQESDVYELQRYCVKSGYTILGGAERLFKHFISDYSPSRIISYSDNNYFDGNIYPRLGFTFIKYTDPDYYWVKSSDLEVLPRYKCQPKLLKNKYPDLYEKAVGGKENFIMTHLGYFKVYGCGNTLWEVSFK